MKSFEDFVNAVYEGQSKTSNLLTKAEVEEVIRIVGDVVANIKDDDRARLFSHNGYVGKFVVTKLAAKKGVSGVNHKQWSKPERKVIRFKSKPNE